MNIIIKKYLKILFPIARSITGKNNRLTLKILKEIVPLKIKSIKSGSKVYDWRIPGEWEIKDAFIKDQDGNKILDYKKNNLSVMNYSTRIEKKIYWNELKKKIYKHPTLKKAIPYRTSYYQKDWGFCVTDSQYNKLSKIKNKLNIKIDSKINSNGKLNYGELIINGKYKKEILISTYFCHPSMANDNLSGVIVTTFLAAFLKNKKNLKWTYRIIFIPETIGAIAYLNKNEKKLKNIDFGLNICNCGGPGKFGYKQSWSKNHFINELVEKTFKTSKLNFKTYLFDINGSDERQYSSPAFRINMITICKDKYYEFPQYHSSFDNLDFVKPNNLSKSLKVYKNLIKNIENLEIYKRTQDHGEIMLKKYNLQRSKGGAFLPGKEKEKINNILWILFLIDGKKDLKTIQQITKINEKIFKELIHELKSKKIIKHVS